MRPAALVVAAGLIVGAGSLPAIAATRSRSIPTSVVTARSWEVTATGLADPLGEPSGPAPAGSDLPPAGCKGSGSNGGPTGAPAGEGILSLTMAAPGTDWSSEANTSTVVDVSIDRGRPQEMVLFAGAEPFRYEGFVGILTAGRHCVTIRVRPDLSHTTSVTPTVEVYSLSIGVVSGDSAAYLLETHAPVLYGRSTSAIGDTPLVTYGQQSPDPDGTDTDLAYTVIWTHEDVGDGAVAAYEWGLWGRMTDIETVLHEKVTPDGRILSASYLSCGCEGVPAYPDIAPENPVFGGETYKPYPASGGSPGLARHLAIRDATGNNDISPTGTTAFRFQQSLVAAPDAGQLREAVMDAHPWTYRISNDEVVRETEQSSDPRSPLAGQYPQYLVVDIDCQPSGTGSVSVAVQLDHGSWYSNDYSQTTSPGPATTFPFYNGGHRRTVIKLPPGWHQSALTGLRLTLNATSPGTTPTLSGPTRIQLMEVTPDYRIVERQVPVPVVTTGTQIVPSQLGH